MTHRLGSYKAGPTPLEPKVQVRRLDLLEAEERERVRLRLLRWRDAWIDSLFEPLAIKEERGRLTPAARGLLYALRQGLGTVDRQDVAENLGHLSKGDRKILAKMGVRLGTETVYVSELLRPAAQSARAKLWSVARGLRPLAVPPADGRATVPADTLPAELAMAIGFRLSGELAVRADLLERVAAEGRRHARVGRPTGLDGIVSWLGSTHQAAMSVLRGLGFRVQPQSGGRVVVRHPRRR